MSNPVYDWKSARAPKLYARPSSRKETVDHPLKSLTVYECIPRRILGSLPNTGKTTPVSTPTIMLDLNAVLEAIDPLTKFSVEEVDPLSKMASEAEVEDISPNDPMRNSKYCTMESWNSRKQGILSKYTTSEKLSIVTSFLSDGDKVVVKAQSTVVSKVQHRLEQLDYFEEGTQKKFDLSQAEYMGRIEQLNKELVSAWNTEQRVKALKIAIQCAKLLADTDVLCFYPSKFVLITDILDIFGNLVYERLKSKADSVKPGAKMPAPLPDDFTADMVSESVKETCRNWFYKIASIRELVPRIYLEMAILKSYRFLTSSEHSDALLRLTRMIRGVGNPLVAIYARCYLCRVGLSMGKLDDNSNYLLQNFHDFLNCYNHMFKPTVQKDLIFQNIDISSYLTLYTPALDYILQAVACNASSNLLEELLEYCRGHGNSPLLLNTIMAAFKPNIIVNRTLQLLGMIQDCKDTKNFPPYLLLRTLGLCVSISSPPIEQRSQILSLVWKQISSLTNPEHYINCAEAWIKFAVQHFSSFEVNAIIGDIIRHLSPDKSYENHYNQLKNIMNTIISNMQDFEVLLSMDNFLPLIDLFHQEVLKVEICKGVLNVCISDQQTSDPVIINALIFLCSILHDSVNALTVDDEKRQISELLCRVIRRVNYGKDFEKQLSFYVEARGAFTNLDLVLSQLVQSVNTLAANTRKIVKGYHTRKTQAFVHACAAYCFITIPSILSVQSQMELYLLSGRVALFNNCLEQADACFAAALTTLSELPISQQTESFIMSYIKNFLSTILVVPDNPNHGVLDLLRNVLNTVKSLDWDTRLHSLLYIYLHVIDVLYSLSQETYLYHVSHVESNDTLYGSDPKFLNEVDKMGSVILEEILSAMKKLGAGRKQCEIGLELLIRVFTRGDLSSPFIQNLSRNLWGLVMKEEYIDKKYLARTKNYLVTLRKNFQEQNVHIQS